MENISGSSEPAATRNAAARCRCGNAICEICVVHFLS